MGLEELGLTAEEAAVYRALVAVPSAQGSDVADAARLPRERTDGALSSLLDRGMVTLGGEGDGRFAAAHPAVALGGELVAHRERLEHAELTVAQLVETYRAASVDRVQRELLEVVEGTEAIRRCYLQIQLSAREGLDILSAGEPRAVTPDDSEEVTVMSRDVRVRAVVDQGFLKLPGAAGHLNRSLADGVHVRTVAEVPCKLIVADGEVAMLPLSGRGVEVDPAVVLRGGLAHVARELFEQVWERAHPYQDPDPAIDPSDVHILRLLLAGLTDTAVAGQLDMSVRTLQRRLKVLMAQAGATTRMQLGWHARHHDWV
ncbi:helix-turn-helix domain-containing protein [Streptomyces sp. NBC_00094]|uniref:helix-turn-helix domain-containing protein n=1 Tax=Streptomyces sp. NBC_00094 TaxID=2903620 RepID=UPI002257E587|nr:helix-turn-helix domain-containing protein [Streptomyces sp. NBC_00094]MCX5389086.1 helix-turn-helix transcriptional regulator [Streptomyces sp. NBC_00094]